VRFVAAAAFVLLALAPAARAASPLAAQASVASGAAPLQVTLTASGGDAPYHWDFGDGTSGDGTEVQHAYAAGRWTATVTDGSGAHAQVGIVSIQVILRAPKHPVGFARRLTLAGTMTPAHAGALTLFRDGNAIPLGRVRIGKAGGFRITSRIRVPGTYSVGIGEARSNEIAVVVRPRLVTRLEGAAAVGQPLAFVAALRPAGAGSLHVRIWKSGRLKVDLTSDHPVRIKLDTQRPRAFQILVSTVPAAGFAGASRRVHAIVAQPRLGLGSRGPSVQALEQRLVDLHYALLGVDAYYNVDTRDAVTAFQKVVGLPRTGSVDPTVWRALARTSVPRARYPSGNHVEVDKGRQVLLEVRNGEVVLVVPVSTGATGNTPYGTWHVYSRVAGWSWVLWYPTYFLRGFAIHGYPDVPPYPASHGCVRVPMWVAVRLFSMHPFGFTIHIY
jgi:N-acetylmuramoyl-L-alanine amidase